MSTTAPTSSNNGVVHLDNGNIEISITLPWSEVSQAYEARVNTAVSQAEVAGFRKGKAPREMVEPKLDRSELTSKALGDLLPEAYAKIVKSAQIKPILYPQIEIKNGKNGQDWEFKATTCEAPIVNLPDYKKELSGITPKPNQSQLSAALENLIQKTQVKIPDLLVQEESNHRLASLAENLSQIGMNLEKYLQTKKITAEDLKSQTAKNARLDLETEFILAEIQSREKLPDREQVIEFIQTLVCNKPKQ